MKNLIIVESPAKAKTIEKYLGKDYQVLSSVGHIRDLATVGEGGLGIDVNDQFQTTYKYITGKKKIVNEIKKAAKDVDFIYLATDPDREGEAISWHLGQELELDFSKLNRVVFNEITKDGIESGMDNARVLDIDLVNSQETRRIIDRIIGFKLSKLMQKKIKEKSAGRVQSVALRLIVERENEIRAFVAIEYYKIVGLYQDITLDYIKNDKQISKEEASIIFASLESNKKLEVSDKKEKEKKQNPYLPFTTSTFQQTSVNSLGYSSKRAMQIAQKLYEGIEIDSGFTGLITYMRTDSTRMSDQFVLETQGYITSEYGKEYLGFNRKTKTKESVQDGHEAIRPTSIKHHPDKIKQFLNEEQYKIYKLIYERALSSLMKSAIIKTVTYKFIHQSDVELKASYSLLKFDGYKKVYKVDKEEEIKSFEFTVGEIIEVDKFDLTQHFTKPPARFSEAKLIKEMEEKGIGRPSTYASTIDVLKNRNYVIIEKKRFIPTESGELVINKLLEFFDSFINVNYTKEMEEKLDLIAIGKEDKLELLKDFYQLFIDLMDKANENMLQIEAKLIGEKCPECGNELVEKKGKYGLFIGCSNFPDCKYIKQEPKETIASCPQCKEGNIIEKNTRKGKIFYACDRYPKCKYAVWNIDDIGKDITPNKKEKK